MYTEDDLKAAVDAKDYKLIVEISTYLEGVKPAKKDRTKKSLPAPKVEDREPESLPWLAPSLKGPPRRFDENGKELFAAEFVSGRRPDVKIDFQTDKKPVAGLTAEQKKAEREKKISRNPADVREPAKKINVECDGCRKKCSVYASAMSIRTNEREAEEYFYECEKCTGRGKRS